MRMGSYIRRSPCFTEGIKPTCATTTWRPLLERMAKHLRIPETESHDLKYLYNYYNVQRPKSNLPLDRATYSSLPFPELRQRCCHATFYCYKIDNRQLCYTVWEADNEACGSCYCPILKHNVKEITHNLKKHVSHAGLNYTLFLIGRKVRHACEAGRCI